MIRAKKEYLKNGFSQLQQYEKCRLGSGTLKMYRGPGIAVFFFRVNKHITYPYINNVTFFFHF